MQTFPTYDTVDLFAGPGGWSVACRRLGLREIGIEFDKAAHMTRRAAGFHTIRDDARNWGPANFPNARGLIASPPCQTFSAAGHGAGRKALDTVLTAIDSMASGARYSPDEFDDVRTSLVLEAFRWVIDAIAIGKPYQWIALEQVPTVLPVWKAMAKHLEDFGYEVETANLQAEQYGVPQTRKRAILVARYGQPVALPTPTHSKFHTRNRSRLDPDVLPWVSMADALGWGDATMRSNYGTGGDPKARGERDSDQPAPTVTGKIDRNRWMLGAGATAPQTAGQVPRDESEPGHTITGKGTAAWVQARNSGPGAARDPRPVEQPSYTIRANGSGSHPSGTEWVHDRPSPTIVGSFRPEIVAAPGWRKAGDGPRQNAPGSVRVTVEEASALQSFPPGFPWQGAETKQYQQVGNAIPPLLAEAVLKSVVDSISTTL